MWSQIPWVLFYGFRWPSLMVLEVAWPQCPWVISYRFRCILKCLAPIPLDPSSMSTDFVGHDTFLLAWLRLNFPRSISTDFGGHRSLYFENAWPQFPWFHFYEFRWPSLIIFECVWLHISLGPFLRASLAIAHCIPKMACPQLPQVQFYRFPWPTFFV